jgi:hypothetical protein
MNKVNVYNNKGIQVSMSTIVSGNNVVPIEFDLKNMQIDTKENIIKLCKYLNTNYHDKNMWHGEWVCVKKYPNSILLKSDKDVVSDNMYYIEIIKEG